MKDIERYTINSITGSTRHISDKHRCLAALAYAEKRGVDRAEAMQIVLDKRYAWLNWLSMTQRRWQCKTRRPSKARFTDSIQLREGYVRC